MLILFTVLSLIFLLVKLKYFIHVHGFKLSSHAVFPSTCLWSRLLNASQIHIFDCLTNFHGNLSLQIQIQVQSLSSHPFSLSVAQVPWYTPVCSSQDLGSHPLPLSPFHFHGGSDGKESACSAGDLHLIPGSQRSPGEGNGYPLQSSSEPGEFHGQRSLAGCSPWGHKVGHDWATNTCTFSSFSLSNKNHLNIPKSLKWHPALVFSSIVLVCTLHNFLPYFNYFCLLYRLHFIFRLKH